VFTRKDKDELVEEIAKLRGEIKALREEKRAVGRSADLQTEINDLTKRLTDLQITEDRVSEERDRERREVEHMVGLERRRQEFEVEQAKRETQVELREAALTEQRKRFEEQMKFIENRLADEVKYLKDDIIKALLKAMPTFRVDRRESVGATNGQED
jgi:DNA anti-recombination protein RmuC